MVTDRIPNVRNTPFLSKAESLSFSNGKKQLSSQIFNARVVRQVQLVEADTRRANQLCFSRRDS